MNHQRSKVLIVEDSRSISSLLANSISSQLNLEVVQTSSMAEAERCLEQQAHEFFIALLDLNLPDAPDGEVVDCVLAYGIPPIILTGHISDNLHDEINEKLIIDYVVKLNLNEIEHVINMVRRLRDNRYYNALIVSDCKDTRSTLRSLLERHFFNVLEAGDGPAALETLKHHDAQLIITSYNMPSMDGAELTARIRSRHSRSEVAIIGIACPDDANSTVNFLKAGANDFIKLPFVREELYCRINQNIDAVRSFEHVKNAANKDFLTGLYNRKFLFEAGTKLFENARRENFSLMAAVIDIDHFKTVNDDHGYHVGDLALQHVAEKLTRQVRGSDIVARLGGEEFCLLCVNADGAQSSENELLKNVSDVIQYSPVDVNDFLCVNLTISIGYTTEVTDTFEEMINNAYSALNAGDPSQRNRLEWYDPLADNSRYSSSS